MKIYGKIVVAMVAMLWGVATLPAAAQEEGFTKQIEIERDYSATVSRADKIEMEPRLLDTTIVRPTMTYSIKSVAHQSDFRVGALKPIEMSTAQWSRPTNFYLNAGIGAPLQTDLDLVWTPVQRRVTTLGLWLDHDGVMARLTNLGGERLSALGLRNRAGLAYKTTFASGTKLSADVDYKGTIANPYGGIGAVERNLLMAHDFGANMSVSGGFGKGSKLGYEVAARGGYLLGSNLGLAEGTLAQAKGATHTIHYAADMALVGLSRVERWLPTRVGAYFYGTHWGAQKMWQSSVVVMPEWSLRVAKHLPIEVAAGYDVAIAGGKGGFVDGLVGNISVAWDNSSRAVPYLRASAERENNLVRTAMWIAPYADLADVDSRRVYNAGLGLRGAARRVSYNVHTGVRHYADYMYVMAVEGSPILDFGTAEALALYYAEAQAEYHPLRQLTISGAVEYKLPFGQSVEALALRPLEGRLGVEYALGSKWLFGVKAHYAMAADYLCYKPATQTTELMTMPQYVDLGASVEWRVTERLSAWLVGDNLLGQTIYHLPTYRQLGAGVRGGVRIVF
ncbi:MAG: hypothetical protein E7134_04840 [Rikenellaceae bacterium]|nr:hypothetical protein [Rikenellaceae bacterium]